MNGKKLNFNATWSMAVGGMIGGGIFSVMGLIVQIAGRWAWMSFIIAGLIALVSAHSYSQLAIRFKKSGGLFTYLRELHYKKFAGGLAWVLIMGYILTVSVYGFTFGKYVAHVFNLGEWFPGVLSIFIILCITIVNLIGIGEASWLEIITVWGKLAVLVLLAIAGMIHWDISKLHEGIELRPFHGSISGAATIFMAYEGFQLLAYDYKNIRNPEKTLTKAIISAVLTVMLIYIAVFIGVSMLVGAKNIISQREISLSYAGKAAFGAPGLVLVTIAAAFSTSSAINATLFSTARMIEDVAESKELPAFFGKENRNHMPYVALIFMGLLSMFLSFIGTLDSLVSAASLIFLFVFGMVNYLAFKEKAKLKYICLAGALCSWIAIVIDGLYLARKSPMALIILICLVIAVLLGRVLVKKYSSQYSK